MQCAGEAPYRTLRHDLDGFRRHPLYIIIHSAMPTTNSRMRLSPLPLSWAESSCRITHRKPHTTLNEHQQTIPPYAHTTPVQVSRAATIYHSHSSLNSSSPTPRHNPPDGSRRNPRCRDSILQPVQYPKPRRHQPKALPCRGSNHTSKQPTSNPTSPRASRSRSPPAAPEAYRKRTLSGERRRR